MSLMETFDSALSVSRFPTLCLISVSLYSCSHPAGGCSSDDDCTTHRFPIRSVWWCWLIKFSVSFVGGVGIRVGIVLDICSGDGSGKFSDLFFLK